MKTVAGIFDSKIIADTAVSRLMDAGFAKDDISLIMSDHTHKSLFNSTDDEANRAAKGGITGAVVGGALGAIIAGLTAVGSIVTAGGTLLIAGPLVAVLSGVGAGATIGGLGGALIRAGFAADEANHFEQEIKHGKAVVVVHVSDDSQSARAHAALGDSGAVVKAA